MIGSIILKDGTLFNVKYQGIEGIKAFYNLCVDEYLDLKNFKIVVEPEIVDLREYKITSPFLALKSKMYDIAEKYKASSKQRPPNNLKIMLLPEFLNSEINVNASEFSLMCTLSDYNLVSEIYNHSPLLDYEITNSLVSLRKKQALKVIQVK